MPSIISGAYAAQAPAAAASGATIIYASGLGGCGYSGLPADLDMQRSTGRSDLSSARRDGITLRIGYMCSTSIVKLAEFDRHWPSELRQQLHTSPAQWMQQNVRGEVLKSWYGGDYEPACMNNPDWRTYQKYVLRLQLDAGMDGIFFDNPTVHPDGCYCPYCMQAFQRSGGAPDDRERLVGRGPPPDGRCAEERFPAFPYDDCPRFYRGHGATSRTLNPKALITANNSLNSPTVLYLQARTYGYSIYEMSKAEDLVVVEEMSAAAWHALIRAEKSTSMGRHTGSWKPSATASQWSR